MKGCSCLRRDRPPHAAEGMLSYMQADPPPHSHLLADDTAVMKPLRRGTRSDLLYVLIQTEGGVSAMVFSVTL